MDLVYFSGSSEDVLSLSVRLSVLAEGVFGLLGFFIFNSDFNLMKGSEMEVMGKDHLFSEVG